MNPEVKIITPAASGVGTASTSVVRIHQLEIRGEWGNLLVSKLIFYYQNYVIVGLIDSVWSSYFSYSEMRVKTAWFTTDSVLEHNKTLQSDDKVRESKGKTQIYNNYFKILIIWRAHPVWSFLSNKCNLY